MLIDFLLLRMDCSMKNIFNRLLAVLVIGDNLYIVLTLMETARNYHDIDNVGYILLHRFALYPLRAGCMTANIYLAVALAVERYRAIR